MHRRVCGILSTGHLSAGKDRLWDIQTENQENISRSPTGSTSNRNSYGEAVSKRSEGCFRKTQLRYRKRSAAMPATKLGNGLTGAAAINACSARTARFTAAIQLSTAWCHTDAAGVVRSAGNTMPLQAVNSLHPGNVISPRIRLMYAMHAVFTATALCQKICIRHVLLNEGTNAL